ncbi:MAG: tetratricopeptide repeat protein [Saprospiraceae bacterium]|nr:tetratricopeptide repeat protein [Saprospiraceae bacterium]
MKTSYYLLLEVNFKLYSNMKNLLKVLLITIYFGVSIFSYAQKTTVYINPTAEYNLAIELFNKEKYGSAQKKFINVSEAISDLQSQMKANSEYYVALCAMELYNNDAEYLLNKFIDTYPENSKVRLAYYHLGKFNFSKKKYDRAIKSFEKVDKYDLTDEELIEFYFNTGYCYFNTKDLEKSKKAFYEIINKETKYKEPANYYYSHIAYTEGNYETALKGFQKLMGNELFSPIIPYYIVQIYFMQKNYDELLKIAPALLEKSNKKRAIEISRLIGEAYFNTNRYKEAIPYLEMFREKNDNFISRADFYQLAYAYYRTQDFENAITSFKNVITVDDSLTQNAHYHIADCYLKTNQKQFAYNSFSSAYKLNYDKDICEDALFNYAKLAYELAYNPYNEAINAFNQYIAEYPKSPRINDANRYLVNLFLSTKNYKSALISIEKIKDNSIELKTAYQKITYFRGVEEFNDEHLIEAIALYDKSLNYSIDKSIFAKCYYWKAEANYRLNNYDLAIKDYNTFLLSPGAFTQPFYNTANYNLGYAFFKKKDYQSALLAFRKFVTNGLKEDQALICDAYLRVGDSYYITKDFNSAIENYDRSIELKIRDVDYALFQKAVSLGVLAQFNEKSATLIKLTEQFPKSAYADDALFELANTYLVLDNNEKALLYLTKIIENYPKENLFVKKSLLKKGLVYYNNNNNDLALSTLKKVVSDYPGTSDAKQALASIRNVYVNLDQTDTYFLYIKSIGNGNIIVPPHEQDSVTYAAKEQYYMKGDCEKAVDGFSDYIEKFPAGSFVINAHFYRAECNYRAQKFDIALTDYYYVINQPISNFTETSVLRAAYINHKLKKYEDALKYYTKLETISEYKVNILESRIWQMRCNFILENYNNTISACNKLLATEKISNELIYEAHMTIAKSAMRMDNIELAQAEFLAVSKMTTSEVGAEAKFLLAQIQYNLQNYDEADKICFDLISQVPSYDYWIAKSFILTADIYLRKGDFHQAKATLKSIIDNYEGADLVKIAQGKYNSIIEAEKAEEKQKEMKLIEEIDNDDDVIKLLDDDSDLLKLFNEESEEKPLEIEIIKEKGTEKENPENNE